MTFRVMIAIAVTLMLSYYGSSDAYAQRARPSAQLEIEGQTESPPAVGRGGRRGAAMGQNVIARADSDGNGVATQDELMAMTLKEAAPAPASAGGRGRGRFRPSAS